MPPQIFCREFLQKIFLGFLGGAAGFFGGAAGFFGVRVFAAVFCRGLGGELLPRVFLRGGICDRKPLRRIFCAQIFAADFAAVAKRRPFMLYCTL